MTHPKGVSMPTFSLLPGQVYVLKKGSRICGQVLSLNPQSQAPTKKVSRIGDTAKSTSFSPVEHTMQMEIYISKDFEELADLLGFTVPASGGWVGTEQIGLNPTVSTYTLTIETYDANTGLNADNLVGTWTITGYRPSSLNVQIQAENESTATLNGEPGNIYYVPAAGVGA